MRLAPGRTGAPLAVAVLAALLAGCAEDEPATGGDRLGATLAQAFRIDAQEVDVILDYRPAQRRVRGVAELRFEMRPGERRPLFHFNPFRERDVVEHDMLRSLELDGERLDPSDPAGLRRVRPLPAAEHAFEVQRDLEDDEEHVLRIRWSMPDPRPRGYEGWLYSNYDDTVGPAGQTETRWPTLSSPEDLIRHRVRVRVHGDRRYTVLGSGTVRRLRSGRVQAWTVDTRRPIPSHTVLVAAVPAEEVRSERFEVDGVPVRIVSDQSGSVIRRARAVAERTIPALAGDFGAFPMPRMEVMLTGWAGGMEYYGATRTGVGALEHELAHMYFGTSVVNRTWRDTWFDEAAVQWWQRRGVLEPPPDDSHSDIGAGRPPPAPGFDERAYVAGARVMEEIARALGGEGAMLAFLADLHEQRAFEPFTTDELLDEVVAAQDSLDRARLDRLLLGAGR
jgi:Peptidase family M1 domain